MGHHRKTLHFSAFSTVISQFFTKTDLISLIYHKEGRAAPPTTEVTGVRRQIIMKRLLSRSLALLLVISLLLTPALAEGPTNSPYRERRPPTPYELGPRWTELDVTVFSGENTLRGTLTAPKDLPDKIPVAILLHGLNTDRSWCDDIAWFLAENEIASVRFDFSGNGKSDGEQTDMTISSLTNDTLAILDYVESLDFTDPDNIFMVGKSMGGVAATLASQTRGDEIKAMCLWYPGFGVTLQTRFGYFLGEVFNPADPPETLEIAGFTYGRDYLTESIQTDLVTPMSQYDRPVLIIHGDRDFITPLVFSFWAAYQFPDCDVHVVPGGGHGFFLQPELFSLGDMLSFLEENIS